MKEGSIDSGAPGVSPPHSISPAKGPKRPKSPPEGDKLKSKSRDRKLKPRRSRSRNQSSSPEYRGRIDYGARRKYVDQQKAV